MIIARAPLRISFFGGGTDHPDWFSCLGRGAVLSTSINKYVYIQHRPLPHIFPFNYRVVWRMVEQVRDINDIQHPVVRSILDHYGTENDGGYEIVYNADLPARSGLGSSSAFTVTLLQAFFAHRGVYLSPRELAIRATFVEQKLLMEPVGNQDQVAVSCGGFNKIEFQPDGNFLTTPVYMSPARRQEFEDHLLLVFTGFTRDAAEIEASKKGSFSKRSTDLERMYEMVAEGVSILENPNGMFSDFGALLHEGWMRKKQLSNKVSNSEIDDVYNEGRSAGALGGKLLGAGGGGFMLFFAPRERHSSILKRLSHLIHVPIRMENGGCRIILHDPELTSNYGSELTNV